MKNRLGIVILALVCLGLFITVITIKRQATAEKAAVMEQAQSSSNRTWVEINGKLEDDKKVIAQFEKDIEVQKSNYDKAITDLTNNYATATANLAKTATDLKT